MKLIGIPSYDEGSPGCCSAFPPPAAPSIACALAAVALSLDRFASASASFSVSIWATMASISGRERFCWKRSGKEERGEEVLVQGTGRTPRRVTDLDFAVPVHDANLDVLRARLDNLEERLDCQLDRLVPRQVVPVVLLEELADRLRRPTDRRRLVKRREQEEANSEFNQTVATVRDAPSTRCRSRSAQ